MWRERRRCALTQGAKPKWIDTKRFLCELHKLRSSGHWQREILHDVWLILATGMESREQHPGAKVFVQIPPRKVVERPKEVLERGESYPESSPIVTEKIFVAGNVFCDRTMVIGDRLPYVQVEPWIFRAAERSNPVIIRSIIREAARDNCSLGFREQNSIHVIMIVFSFGELLYPLHS